MKKSCLFVFLGLMVSIAPLQSGKRLVKKFAAVSVGSKALKGGGGSNDSGSTPMQYPPTSEPAPMSAPSGADPFSSPVTSGKLAVPAGDVKKVAQEGGGKKQTDDKLSYGYSQGFSEGFSKGFSEGKKSQERPVSHVE